MKKPGMPYFTPDKRLCLILGNNDYSAIRWGTKTNAAGEQILGEDGKPKQYGYADLPAVLDDMKVFSTNIERYDFDADLDIVQKNNISVPAVKKVFLGYQR